MVFLLHFIFLVSGGGTYRYGFAFQGFHDRVFMTWSKKACRGFRRGKLVVLYTKMGYMEKTIDKRPSRLEELFLDELTDLYGAEQHQLHVLPLLKHAASSQKLKNVLSSHLDDTREQIGRLEAIFEKMGHRPEARTPEAILGLTHEAEKVIS